MRIANRSLVSATLKRPAGLSAASVSQGSRSDTDGSFCSEINCEVIQGKAYRHRKAVFRSGCRRRRPLCQQEPPSVIAG